MVTERESSDRDQVLRERIELVATVLLALATVLTAWSAFESTKWSGTQSIHFARASADRTESAKSSGRTNAQVIVDVDTFVSWITAVANERRADPNASRAPDGTYVPDPTMLSGFLYERLRSEFQPAVNAWLAQRPLDNPAATAVPFTLPEYRLKEQTRADRFEKRADRQAALARRDNQRGDNYVLTTVLFASVLFFAGVSNKLGNTRNRLATVGLAGALLVVGIVIISTFPVQI